MMIVRANSPRQITAVLDEHLSQSDPERKSEVIGSIGRSLNSGAKAWIAVSHGETIGLVVVRTSGEIARLYVTPSKRGERAGTLLRRVAEDNGGWWFTVHEDDHQSRGWLTKAGYQTIGNKEPGYLMMALPEWSGRARL